ncbi:MAG: NADH-quinone oxidoreductase subunit L [Gammaproteobacteria bacterium]|nr:NADH-quinone oxidoreductase subunit L [Gammaproteobacteria bacterium]
MSIHILTLITVFAPLLGSLIAGLLAKRIGTRGAHFVTISLVLISFIGAIIIFKAVALDGQHYSGVLYHWAISGRFTFDIGFLIDPLTAIMLLIVTFVSSVVHIYSVGYMRGDPGYQRFFSYVSLFTFAMLLLVTANNFLQLFIGWEGVGLVSYLLIGFWFTKESAANGSFKAFIANRIGDFGFILGLAAILDSFGTLNYAGVFAKAQTLAHNTMAVFPHTHWALITVICVLLFIGAMGKSAQVPLHVWLPESMEGPTPISALIHAATMVTAGVFMVARMSPLFELSQPALSMVMIVGATGAFFLGLLAFVEFDIKRVIAYSTMSQLGYMMAANGASAYAAGIFHLVTHGCFKALLFLSAGSVIIAMHHEQDLRKMGNLKKYIPVTYICFLIGALALSAIPPFAGFYSKDAIIEAVHHSHIFGAHYAYTVLLMGSFVTGYYIFRAFFMAFHTKERFGDEVKSHLREHWVMLVPMIALAIPSVILGACLVRSILYKVPGLLGHAITVLPKYNVLGEMAKNFHGWFAELSHAVFTLPFWFAASGVVAAWVTVIGAPQLPVWLKQKFNWLYQILYYQFGFDKLNELIFVRFATWFSSLLYRVGDLKLVDGLMVDGSSRNMQRIARLFRRMQTGYLYHYVLVMILALLGLLIWMVWWR